MDFAVRFCKQLIYRSLFRDGVIIISLLCGNFMQIVWAIVRQMFRFFGFPISIIKTGNSYTTSIL